jgi:DNA-binding CsgD family transcriptional regulator
VADTKRPGDRKLSREQVEAIRKDAGHRTLRDLAAAFGVSHETIRAVLRQRGAIAVRWLGEGLSSALAGFAVCIVS